MTKWMVGIWFVCCLAGLSIVSVKQLVDYDPDLKLSAAISDIGFELAFTDQLSQNHSEIGRSVVHFSDSNCFCTTLADAHITQLSNTMQKQGFANIHVNINEAPEFAKFIPSIPSVAIIGKEQELIYLGPYSVGYGCLTGTGLVDAILPKAISPNVENTLLITDAKGCYCST